MSYACVNSCLIAYQNVRKRGLYKEYLRDASKMPCLMKRQTQGLIADESESRPGVEAETSSTTVTDDITANGQIIDKIVDQTMWTCLSFV